VAAPRRRVVATTHRLRAKMAPSKKGAKTQTQVVHHDEDDLIQVRVRDDANEEETKRRRRAYPGCVSIVVPR
jgi:hypothetical protein